MCQLKLTCMTSSVHSESVYFHANTPDAAEHGLHGHDSSDPSVLEREAK